MRGTPRPGVVRSVVDGRVRSLIAGYEIERTGHHVVWHVPVGAERASRRGQRSGPRADGSGAGYLRAADYETGFDLTTWRLLDVIMVHPFGHDWSVWRWLDPATSSGWHPGSYVNLEADLVERPFGWDTADWTLDVVVDAAGRTSYKDEDELAWLLEVGESSAEFGERVRAAGREAVVVAQAGGWPFNADWEHWRPEPLAGQSPRIPAELMTCATVASAHQPPR